MIVIFSDITSESEGQAMTVQVIGDNCYWFVFFWEAVHIGACGNTPSKFGPYRLIKYNIVKLLRVELWSPTVSARVSTQIRKEEIEDWFIHAPWSCCWWYVVLCTTSRQRTRDCYHYIIVSIMIDYCSSNNGGAWLNQNFGIINIYVLAGWRMQSQKYKQQPIK